MTHAFFTLPFALSLFTFDLSLLKFRQAQLIAFAFFTLPFDLCLLPFDLRLKPHSKKKTA